MYLTRKSSKFIFSLEGEPLTVEHIARIRSYIKSPFGVLNNQSRFIESLMVFFALLAVSGFALFLIFCAILGLQLIFGDPDYTRTLWRLAVFFTICSIGSGLIYIYSRWLAVCESLEYISDFTEPRSPGLTYTAEIEKILEQYPEFESYIHSVIDLKRPLLKGEIEAMETIIAQRGKTISLAEPVAFNENRLENLSGKLGYSSIPSINVKNPPVICGSVRGNLPC